MSKILVLTPQFPYPPRQGTALRNWGILRGLAAHHEVSLLSFASPDQALTPDPLLESITERLAVVPQPARSTKDRLRDLLITGRPDLAQRLVSSEFSQKLSAWVSGYHFDWVMIEGLEMAPYLTVLESQPSSLRDRIGIIFDDHNCEYLLQQRTAQSDYGSAAPTAAGPRRSQGGLSFSRWARALYSSIQWRRLRDYEADVCRRADIVVAVSRADAEALRGLVPEIQPLVVPNGIDVSTYAGFREEVELARPAYVFTGTMDFRPNVDGVLWYAQHIWPLIRKQLPGAHFYVVGRHPHARLTSLREVPGVVITGGVPDTRPYIRAADVYVVPLLVGGGTRLKLLESTAMGKPIVATQLAAEGFSDPGRAMILADTPEAFAKACVMLADNSEARALWGSRARAYADSYDWEVLLPALLDRLGR